MKKQFVLIFILLVSPLSARPDIYISTGTVIPAKPDYFQKGWQSGYLLSAGLCYLSNNIEFIPKFSYAGFPVDDTDILKPYNSDKLQYYAVSKGMTSIFSLLIETRSNLNAVIGVGLGVELDAGDSYSFYLQMVGNLMFTRKATIYFPI